MGLRRSRFRRVRLGFVGVRLRVGRVLRLGRMRISPFGVGFVRTVMTAIELADFGPGMPFTACRPNGEGHGQSYGAESRYHGEPVTRFVPESTVST